MFTFYNFNFLQPPDPPPFLSVFVSVWHSSCQRDGINVHNTALGRTHYGRGERVGLHLHTVYIKKQETEETLPVTNTRRQQSNTLRLGSHWSLVSSRKDYYKLFNCRITHSLSDCYHQLLQSCTLSVSQYRKHLTATNYNSHHTLLAYIINP